MGKYKSQGNVIQQMFVGMRILSNGVTTNGEVLEGSMAHLWLPFSPMTMIRAIHIVELFKTINPVKYYPHFGVGLALRFILCSLSLNHWMCWLNWRDNTIFMGISFCRVDLLDELYNVNSDHWHAVYRWAFEPSITFPVDLHYWRESWSDLWSSMYF